MKHKKEHLQICQLNVSGVSVQTTTAINKYNDQIRNDIVALQETLLSSTDDHSQIFNNMHTYTVNNSRGVSISARFDLLPQEIKELKDDVTDAVWITIKFSSSIVMVGNLYVNHSRSSSNNISAALSNISSALEYCKKFDIKNIILIGDFNSRHTTWGDSKINDRGRTLLSFITTHNLTCISPNTHTFLSRNGGSVIDLSLLKGDICQHYQSTSVDSEVELFTGAPLCGHLPVIHQFHSNTSEKSRNSVRLYKDLENTNWKEWNETLQDKLEKELLPTIMFYSNPMTLWLHFLQILNSVNTILIPLKRVCDHSKPFWTAKLTILSHSVQSAKSKMDNNFTPYNIHCYKTLKEEFSATLISEKNNWIHKKLDGLNVNDSLQFWKNYRRTLTGKTTEFMGNLVSGGKLCAQPEEKEQLLFKSFFSGEHMIDSTFDKNFDQEIESSYESLSSSNFTNTSMDPIIDEHLNGEISFEEVLTALKDQKVSAKSFDLDDIHPKMLKNLPSNAISTLQSIFNLVLDSAEWVWDTSSITFIKKDGKTNYLKASSYRPISISSYVGKMLERVLEKRLRLHCELEGFLDEEQEGFRQNRNTTRYLYKLIATLDECKRKKLTSFLLCIDFTKAFDSVWLKGLIVKLNGHMIQGKTLNLLNCFLFNRKVKLRINNNLGYSRLCGLFGLPQGSVLAPLLFIIFVSDMLSRKQLPILCQTYFSLFKYADDGSIAVSHTDVVFAHSIMQKMCDYLNKWCSKWKLTPNCDKDKTECIVIYPASPPNLALDPLKIGDKTIAYTKQSVVLGLKIDKDLNFNAHASLKLKQCWYAWFSLSKKTNRQYGLNCSSLVLLFKAVVLTKLLYAAPIWLHCNLGRFKDFFSRVCLKISGSTHHPPRNLITMVLNIPPMEILYKIVCVKFMLKSFSSDHYMKGLISQLDQAKSHRFQHQIDLLKKFLAWKNNSNLMRRSKLDILSLSFTELQYTKEDMTKFTAFLWEDDYSHPSTSFGPNATSSMSSVQSKILFPRSSSRKTDTKVMSVIHGHDLKFRRFRSSVIGDCTQKCTICPTETDDNLHQIFKCPKFNCVYRTYLKDFENNYNPIWSILCDTNPPTHVNFRNLAQIIMGSPHQQRQ